MDTKAYLTLLRPANLITAIADIFAGMAIVDFLWNGFTPIFLIYSTLCLYGGGVVLNDYFDSSIDRIERPERPIPSGKVSPRSALAFGSFLLGFGLIFAFLYQIQSGWIAASITILVLTYNRFAKHNSIFGPIVMGMCRGGNLILGMSLATVIQVDQLSLAILPVLYIAAITMISRGEVHGGKKEPLVFAGILYLTVFVLQLSISYHLGNFFLSLPFVLFHSGVILPPLFFAFQKPVGPLIGKAVKMGVISLIILNASFAASFGFIVISIFILCLLPLSLVLAKYFSVT